MHQINLSITKQLNWIYFKNGHLNYFGSSEIFSNAFTKEINTKYINYIKEVAIYWRVRWTLRKY